MATKKPAPKKAAVKAAAKSSAKKPVAKKPVAKKPAAKTINKKGTKYTCEICGMVVSVDTVCDCSEVCDLVCCDEPMIVM
jgi:hypothetical protein